METEIDGDRNRVAGDLLFKVYSEPQIFFFWETFHGISIFLFTLRVLARNSLRESRQSNFFIFSFDVWSGVWSVSSLHLISQHIELPTRLWRLQGNNNTKREEPSATARWTYHPISQTIEEIEFIGSQHRITILTQGNQSG